MRRDVVRLGVVLAVGGLAYGSSRIPAPEAFPSSTAGVLVGLHTDPSSRNTADARARSRRYASRHSPGAIALHVREAAARHGLPQSLVAAVISVESEFNPRAVSRRGALGLMQLMPTTAAMLGVRDAFDPGQNIDGGARYLRDLIDRFSGDLPLALAAYNAGAQAVIKHRGVPPYPETRAFVARVLTRAGAIATPAAAVVQARPGTRPATAPASTPVSTPASTTPRGPLVRQTVEHTPASKNDPSTAPAAFSDGRTAANASPAPASESAFSATGPPAPAQSEAP